MRAKRLLLLPSVVFLACKPPTPAEQIDSVLSWIGTAGMAGVAWLRHTTPDTYTRQTLELSQKRLVQISHDLLEAPPPNTDVAVLNDVLTRSRGRVARMAALIAAKNAPDFARELDSLRADQKVIKRLSDTIKSHQ
jgi:hypothetical protein